MITAFRRALDPPLTEQADDIDSVWTLNLWLAIAVFVFVLLLTLYVMVRFRRRDELLPEQKQYNIPIEIAYTVIPLVVILALFAVTFVSVRAVQESPEPDVEINVTAFQWQWEFDYPAAGVSVVGGEGDDVPELVLPANSTVRFRLESLDVIHSFWITAFRFKQDAIPGQINQFTVDVHDVTGYYPNAGVCAEFCGLDHALMRFSVRILDPDDFDAWLIEAANTRRGGEST